MDNTQRTTAEFWARLASIPSLDELREGERMLLVEDMQQKFLPWLDDPAALEAHIGSLPSWLQNPVKRQFPLENPKRSLPHLILLLHGHAQRIIVPLVNRQEVIVPIGGLPEIKWAVTDDEQLHEEWVDARKKYGGAILNLEQHFLADLIQLLRDHRQRLPFRRCPVCATIFVRVKRQRYCSPNCTYEGIETARKEEKRGYMRDYMAKRRKKAKARQSRKEK